MPAARRDCAKNPESAFNEIETASSESGDSAHSKPDVAWNRPHSTDVIHKPVFKRHDAAPAVEAPKTRRYAISTACTPEEGQHYCCCSGHSGNLNSCWKLKRRQIIWESSHASATDRGVTTTSASTATATKPTKSPKLTTSFLPVASSRRRRGSGEGGNAVGRASGDSDSRNSRSHIARRVQNGSTSLPGTPNLSQLCRPQRVQYKKLSLDAGVAGNEGAIRQQHFAHTIRQLQMSATRLQQAPVTSADSDDATVGRQQMVIDDEEFTAVGRDGDDGDVNSKLHKTPSGAAAARWASRQQAVTSQIVAKTNNNNNNNSYESLMDQGTSAAGTTTSDNRQTQTDLPALLLNNNNNNNDNAQPAILLPLPVPLPLPVSGSMPTATLASTSPSHSPAPAATSSTTQTVAKSSLAFCEHCCESASIMSSNGSYAHGAHAVRAYAAEDSDRLYRAATDSVSDLSSYRFVSDEDEISARTANETVAESQYNNSYSYSNTNSNNNHKRTALANVDPFNAASRSPNAVPSAAPLHPPAPTSIRSPSLSSALLLPTATATEAKAAATESSTARISSARLASPVVCCYSIDKPASVHYNATVVEYLPTVTARSSRTAPVPIPQSNPCRNPYDSPSATASGAAFLSTSLPSNYGSERNSEISYQRLKSATKKQIPPPPPPKPKQGAVSTAEASANGDDAHAISESDLSLLDRNGDHAYVYGHVADRSCLNNAYYDPESFRRKVQQFQNDSFGNVDSESADRRLQYLSHSLERSASPERCELLSCFGTVKNTYVAPDAASKHNDEFTYESVTGSENNGGSEYELERERERKRENRNDTTKCVACVVSQSSCLPVASIDNEKCAINNKNNQQHHQYQHQQHHDRLENHNKSGCRECNNNDYHCRIQHRANNSQSLPVPVPVPVPASVHSLGGELQKQQQQFPCLSSSLPKRTLRYDSYGRLKSERISQLPTSTGLANGRKSASETRLHRVHRNFVPRSERQPLSGLSAKLTPTFCRKLNYLSDRFEDCVLEKDELEESDPSCPFVLPSQTNGLITTIAQCHGDQISVKNGTTTAVDTPPLTPTKTVPPGQNYESAHDLSGVPQAEPHKRHIFKSLSDTQNFVANKSAINVHNNNNNNNNISNNKNDAQRCYSEVALHSSSTNSATNQPTSPTTTASPVSPTSPLSPISLTSSGLSQKISHSLPSVSHANGTQSPLWLSSETIELRFSEQRGPDDALSNCSDQTTIFHLENDCSFSGTSSSPSSQLQSQSQPGGTILRGPLILKRIPAIQSFGYIPTHSSSLGSANVREYGDKEINMEKRRNTLDRFQRLGFGRKSTSSTASSAATAQQQSQEGSGSTQNRKSSEKSERLRELTELLRGNRSSPTPPPVPPPRKQRNGSQSASNSFERPDTHTTSHTAAAAALATGDSVDSAPLSFMSTRSDDIMLMDQDEQATDTQHTANAPKAPSIADNLQQKNVNSDTADLGRNSATTATAKAMTTRLYDTLKPNTSLSNFESLMLGREKSKSPPPLAPPSGSSGADRGHELAASTDIATKLARPESRTVIGSYAQKGIPFRSASFSQIDLTSGKYKKSSWSALRDRLWRDKVVGSADAASSSAAASASLSKASASACESRADVQRKEKTKTEPDWIYIPLKKKTEMSINLNYGQEIRNLENVNESPDMIPEEDIFGTDTEQSSSIAGDSKDVLPASNIAIAHAKMESLTDTIQSENDYAIEEQQLPATVESVAAVVEADAEAKEKAEVLEKPAIKEPIAAKLASIEPNVATLMEERITLESPPDNFLQTATTCLIPVPVYECAAQDWRMENPPQEWVEVAPEEFGIIPETIGPLISLEQCAVATAERKTEQEYRAENVPTISVSRSSEEADDKCILRRKESLSSEQREAFERRQGSVDHPEVKKRYSHDDMEIGTEKRSSLDAIATRHSTDERKRIDKSKRRKGMYIDNAAWSDPPGGTPHSRGLALDISIANLNAIKPDTPEECGVMYINSPPTDETRTPGSLYSPDLNTPESECSKPPVWTKAERLTSFSCQSSEEKDDGPGGVGGSCGSAGTCSGLPRNNKTFPFLRTDSVSDNESDRTPPNSRDRASPSPAPNDNDFKRFSKRPLRGPYGQMLEAEMKKPNKMHFEEILEELRESEITTQPRRLRVAHDDASCGSGTDGGVRNLPHYSSSMRVRKTSTHLPVPAHARAASTPSQIENVSKSGGGIDKINPHEKRYQSTLDNSVCDDKGCHEADHHYHHHHHLRDMKRAASEAPAPKAHHSKRSQSMGGEKVSGGAIQAVHQQKRSLDATTTGTGKHKAGGSAKGATLVPSQELLAELLQGSSEKLLSEQRQQMSADTRTHVVQEIFRNEQSYVESLQTIVTKYLKVLKSPEHAGMIDSRTVDEIFFMVPDILEIHEKFLTELRARLDNWDAMQKVGDAFLETFSKLEVLEVYTSFVNNCNRAKNAIRSTKHQRPSFAKFLETTAREHKGKLTLDNLLIKPVQKFPNYEMLFQRLIKHTDHDHPDQKHLQDVLKLVHDILVHINCKEREILENGQREATLRELEGVIEGITDLIAPDRQFLLFDLVSMPSGQGARKERGFFLFNDLLVLTSIKKRSGTIRKPNTSTCPGTVASTLDTNKYKFLTKISLDCLEIVKTKDENVKRIMNEIENLAEDCNKLQQIADITASLKYPHQYLEDVIRELLRDVQRQLSERQTNDAQLNMLELMVNSPNGSQKLSVVFSKAEKRTQWEETFNEAKQKLAATLERHPIPEFLMSIPIRKTRAGLQFTCAAATLSEKRDVWVCNSDGYVGQVCIMSLYPEPNVTSCNGVCNARILCVSSVPAYSPNSSNAAAGAQQQQQHQHQHHRSQPDRSSATSTPQHSYTQQLRDYRKSISPNCQTPSVIGTPEKKRTPSGTANASTNTTNSDASANNNGSNHNNSDVQLDLNLSSSDDEADASGVGGGAPVAGGSVGSGGTASSSGSGNTERVPSPAPSTQTTASSSTASTAVMGSAGGGTPYHSHQDSNPEDSEGNLSTMWIGTEDGCIHVYNSTDNIRIKKNRIKIEHQSAVYSILYLDNRVFVSLANGDICVYLRDGAAWNTSSSHCLPIGTVTSPVTKLLNVHGKLWCSIQGIIKVLDVETLLVVNQIQISSDSKPITNMTVSNNYVWISIQNSAHIKCFHSISHQLITEVNLAPAVNKMLSNCDEIIRQHKAACLRVTSLLSCRDLIWIGTSAGVLLTIPAQGYEKGAPNVVPTGIPHGHTGHVRFLTFVETSGLSSEGSGSGSGSSAGISSTRDSEGGMPATEYKGQGSIKHSKPKSESSNILIISGGDGYEDFRNSGANSLSEIAGREDSTNHLLIWQI